MPYPRKTEDKNTYISRCVKYLIDKEGKPQKRALGQCYGMWKASKRGKVSKELIMKKKNTSKKPDNWIQGANIKAGALGDWCRTQGFGKVNQECINKAAREGGHLAKMALFAVNVSKGKYNYPKISERKKIISNL